MADMTAAEAKRLLDPSVLCVTCRGRGMTSYPADLGECRICRGSGLAAGVCGGAAIIDLAAAVIRLEARCDELAARVVGRVVLRQARIGDGQERGVVVDTHPERGWLVWWSHARVTAWTSPDALSTP